MGDNLLAVIKQQKVLSIPSRFAKFVGQSKPSTIPKSESRCIWRVRSIRVFWGWELKSILWKLGFRLYSRSWIKIKKRRSLCLFLNLNLLHPPKPQKYRNTQLKNKSISRNRRRGSIESGNVKEVKARRRKKRSTGRREGVGRRKRKIGMIRSMKEIGLKGVGAEINIRRRRRRKIENADRTLMKTKEITGRDMRDVCCHL